MTKTLGEWGSRFNEWTNRRGIATKEISAEIGKENNLELVLGKEWEVKVGLKDAKVSKKGKRSGKKPLGELSQGKRKREEEEEFNSQKHGRIGAEESAAQLTT